MARPRNVFLFAVGTLIAVSLLQRLMYLHDESKTDSTNRFSTAGLRTWHLKGWRERNGVRQPWEISYQATPRVYLEREGDCLILQDEESCIVVYPKGQAGSPYTAIRTTPKLAPPSLKSFFTWTVSDFEPTTGLPQSLRWQKDGALLAELTAQYNKSLPQEAISLKLPKDTFEIDLARPVSLPIPPHTASVTRGGITVQATAERDPQGIVQVRLTHFLVGRPQKEVPQLRLEAALVHNTPFGYSNPHSDIVPRESKARTPFVYLDSYYGVNAAFQFRDTAAPLLPAPEAEMSARGSTRLEDLLAESPTFPIRPVSIAALGERQPLDKVNYFISVGGKRDTIFLLPIDVEIRLNHVVTSKINSVVGEAVHVDLKIPIQDVGVSFSSTELPPLLILGAEARAWAYLQGVGAEPTPERKEALAIMARNLLEAALQARQTWKPRAVKASTINQEAIKSLRMGLRNQTSRSRQSKGKLDDAVQ